jgi:hypothetical protein
MVPEVALKTLSVHQTIGNTNFGGAQAGSLRSSKPFESLHRYRLWSPQRHIRAHVAHFVSEQVCT